MCLVLWLACLFSLRLTLPESATAGSSYPLATANPVPTLHVAWGGDVMLGRGIAEGMRRTGRADPLAALRPRLAAADLLIANLEGPLTSEPHRTDNRFVLTAPPERVDVLAAAGFDALALANNHATDSGRAGLAETLAALRGAGIQPIGAGDNAAEAWSPVMIDRGGLRLVLLAFNAAGGSLAATDDAPGVALLDIAAATASVRAAKRLGDLVIVQVHWGIEYARAPTADQRIIARRLVDAGADAVIGHHPHVVQPIEWIARPDRRPALVAYSLGNLVFDSLEADAQRSILLETRLAPGGVAAVRILPLATDWRGARPLGDPEVRDALMRRLFPRANWAGAALPGAAGEKAPLPAPDRWMAVPAW